MPIRDWAVSTGSLTAILVTSVLLPVSGAHAQEDAIARCRTAATAEARIACLEDALRADSREDVVETPQTAETGQRRGFRLPGLPFGNREQRDSEGAVAAQADETMPSVDGLGAEQVNARRSNRRSVQLAAAEVDRVDSAIAVFEVIPYERLEITLANGQVWRQISADNQRVATRMRQNRDYTASIQEGRLGGYQLRINELSRIIRVERIR